MSLIDKIDDELTRVKGRTRADVGFTNQEIVDMLLDIRARLVCAATAPVATAERIVDQVLEWDVLDGDVLGATIVCGQCAGAGYVPPHLQVCDDCSGIGALHTRFRSSALTPQEPDAAEPMLGGVRLSDLGLDPKL